MAVVPAMDRREWDRVVELTKRAQDRGNDSLSWAIELSVELGSAGVALPSAELADVLVSHVCWENNVPMAWKYLEKAVSMNVVPPMLVLALLSTRVVPSRRLSPAAYRLYLELLRRHSFSFFPKMNGPNYLKIFSSIDEALHLSQTFGMKVSQPGILVVAFVFAMVRQLLHATLDDEGLLSLTIDKAENWLSRSQDMEIDGAEHFIDKRNGSNDKLQKINMQMAIELIAEFLQHKTTSRLLELARNNMSLHFEEFLQRIELLAAKSTAIKNSSVSAAKLIRLSSSFVPRKLQLECKRDRGKTHASFASRIVPSLPVYFYQACWSALWIPLDMFLEDCIDCSQIAASCAVEILSGLIKVLQAVNETTWQDTFLGAWLAALRLVQRERDPIEGPAPSQDTRLSILLSVTTQSIADIIEEEETIELNGRDESRKYPWKDISSAGQCRQGLISCLQVLGDYEGLLTPPQSVLPAANQAVAKAVMFVSGIPVESGYVDCVGINDNPVNYSGNMWHLIVEACIARNLVDTSAYIWPGYLTGRFNKLAHGMPVQGPSWSSLMKGAPLTVSMVNCLVATPASSLAELEKIFEIALDGSDDERASAATILCGASLIRGWNIQEYTVRFVVKLLSPPVPFNYSGSESHLLCYAPMLYVLLIGISPIDCTQVFSLQGLVPELAGTLMAICEVFGSCEPNIVWSLPTGEEITAHSVFSNAFILLLRLWKFNHPPLEHCVMGDGAPVGSQLTPEYLLLIRNSQRLSEDETKRRKNKSKYLNNESSATLQPIFMDSFPKLKVWYRQHQACIASTLSGLVHGTPVHQTVDGLLNMMFRKMNKGGSQSAASITSGSSSLSSSSGPCSEDASSRPKLPAWEILEAVPFVVNAALSACSHGRLSPRELATGLKDLADFLPASLATIVSFFSSEVTRGVWRPAFMNGTDWPSPAANLASVEEQIKKILAVTGVNVPSLVAGGSSPATLPLPLAAFVSLTITYKLDRVSERFLNLAGPALENLAAGCPWPSMPIVASLWTQKVKRWSDFLIFSASRTVFKQNKDAVVQLLKSCFTASLGLSADPVSRTGGVGGLLGNGFGSKCSGGFLPVAPGFLYLRVYRSIREIMFVTEEILSLLMMTVKEVANSEQSRLCMDKLKNTKYSGKYGSTSLEAAMNKIKAAAGVGASLLWLSGGFALVRTLFHETLPSWFLSCHGSEQEVGGGTAAVLGGHALAHFAVLCSTLSCGLDITNIPKTRSWIIGAHMEFLASALNGNISLGCNKATWRTYVTVFIKLMLKSAPSWVMAVEVDVLRSLSAGLRLWNEEELALMLLAAGGTASMGLAAEFIVSTRD